MEFLHNHTNVITQYSYRYGASMNPYALGFAIFMDIKRMCENPTDEDRHYFPNVAGKNWVEEVNYAMMNFNDETFIMQYLSPKVVRDFKLFHIHDDYEKWYWRVDSIQNEDGFYQLRETLSKMYDINSTLPIIRVTDVDVSGDRTMLLEHDVINGVPLDEESAMQTIFHVAHLWEFRARLKTIDPPEGDPPEAPSPWKLIGYGGKQKELDLEVEPDITRYYAADGRYSCGDDSPSVWVEDKDSERIIRRGKIIIN
jgi:spore cortex formation protein SpoVR/YcgB (stage V sporulation)